MILQITNLILFSILHFFCGWGIIHFFKIELNSIKKISLSFLIGIVVSSLIPLLIDMLFLDIQLSNLYIFMFVITVAVNVKNRFSFKEFIQLFQVKNYSIQLYEWVFIVAIAYLLFASVWRCYYTPVTPRDALVGAELIAKYAVLEKTLISSVFTDNIAISSNNVYKSPYMFGLQIIYKLLGFGFGKLWLSELVILFIIFLYDALKETLHPVIIGTLMLLFIAIPEMYAFSFMILYDYSNAIYTTIGIFFLHKYLTLGKNHYFYFSTLILSFATYIRSETLYFILFGAILIFFYKELNGIQNIKNFKKLLRAIVKPLILLISPLILHFLWFNLYMKFYMPISYDISSLINPNLFDISNLIEQFFKIFSQLFFGAMAKTYYLYFSYIFIFFVVLELVIFRKLKHSWYYFTWVIIIYVGYAIMVHMLPLVVINMTVKRGFFKIFPIMLLYMSYNQILTKLSNSIYRWEQ